MKTIKKIAWCLLHPPVWITLPLIPLAVILLVLGLSDQFAETALAYISYLLSAYTLTVVVIALPTWIKGIRSGFQENVLMRRIRQNKWGALFLDDIFFRSKALIYQGLVSNLIYAVFRQVSAFLYASVWFGAIAVYYTFLCIVKGILIFRSSKVERMDNKAARSLYEWKSYGLCGGLMLLLNAGMTGIIIMMVRQNQHFSYPGFVIYLSAAYTFYIVITAVINIFKFRKLQSPMLSASKAVTLVSAMMSLMVLQTALISQFGAENVAFRQIANSLTGGAVCLFSLSVAIYMSVRAAMKMHSEINL